MRLFGSRPPPRSPPPIPSSGSYTRRVGDRGERGEGQGSARCRRSSIDLQATVIRTDQPRAGRAAWRTAAHWLICYGPALKS